MLIEITGSATMGYYPPVGNGWWIALFIGVLWLITLIVLDYRIAEIKAQKHQIKRLTKLLGNTLQ